jgi:hypothetical protein
MKRQIFIVAAFIAATGVSAQVTTTEALKTRTKSNQANEKSTPPDGLENVTAAVKLQSPKSGKEFTADEAKKSIAFRWTPLVPKPQNVTYRLKVWQLMQGQNSTQAMRTNKPIITKDVMDITQATVSGIYTGPCRPPYLCDFIWTIEAIAADGKPITENTTPEFFNFTFKNNGDVSTSTIKE